MGSRSHNLYFLGRAEPSCHVKVRDGLIWNIDVAFLLRHDGRQGSRKAGLLINSQLTTPVRWVPAAYAAHNRHSVLTHDLNADGLFHDPTFMA